MSGHLLRTILLPGILLLLITSCTDKRLQIFTANVPIYMSYDELRTSFVVDQVRDLEKPGKIYFKDNYIFINEYHEGIHVVDISNPSSPEIKSFISIPGNVDMAIRNQILYADSYVDLVQVDVSDPSQPTLIKREEDFFEYVIPPYDYDYPLDEIDQDKGVITGYELKEITREIQSPHYPWPIYYDYVSFESSMAPGFRGGGGNSYGVAGSMARFLTYDDFLYVLESTYQMKSIRIDDNGSLEVANKQHLWGNIETMFIQGEYMYIGSSDGMHILSLDNPAAPNHLSTYRHITSCDPVVVRGDRAYVTLRAGNLCGGDQNLLEVIDISNKYDPELMASYSMTEPYGLGIDSTTLFICEGEKGLKVYDVSDSYHITDNKIAEFNEIHAWDVIPLDGLLLLIGDAGFLIYDYSDLQDIKLNGSIPVGP